MQSQNVSAIMSQEPLTSCLTITTYKKQVHKLKLVEAASQFFVSKIKIAYQLKNRYFARKLYRYWYIDIDR